MFYVAKFLEFFYKYDTTYVIISTFKSVCPSGVGSSRIQRSYQRGATARIYPHSWTTGSGWCSHSKNFKTTFSSRYQKFLSWGNSNGSRTTPNFFEIIFSTNMIARGFQSFCILEDPSDPLIEQ